MTNPQEKEEQERITNLERPSLDEEIFSDITAMDDAAPGAALLTAPSLPEFIFTAMASQCTLGGFGDSSPMMADAWENLRRSLVYFHGRPVGCIAALDSSNEEALNYNQVTENCTSSLGFRFCFKNVIILEDLRFF